MCKIAFFSEDITFQLPHPHLIRPWIKQCIHQTEKQLIHINYIFCSDAYIHQLNQQHLQHDYPTDVLTFNYADDRQAIEADAYISVQRIKEHATTFNTTFYHELCRVMIHAVLHLLGHEDKTPQQQKHMHSLENFWLSQPTLIAYLKNLPNTSPNTL